jgi:hypothetical protein
MVSTLAIVDAVTNGVISEREFREKLMKNGRSIKRF